MAVLLDFMHRVCKLVSYTRFVVDTCQDAVADEEALGVPRRGRPRTVDTEMIARVALGAFLDEGYDATTMSTIASLAGVGRKTVFSYFSSKAEIVWRGFDPIHARFVEFLHADRESSPSSAIARCAARAATVFPAGMGTLRAETLLVEDHQELRGYGEMRSRRWVRTVVEDAVGRRPDLDCDAAELMGTASWDAVLLGLRRWAHTEDPDPGPSVRHVLGVFEQAFSAVDGSGKRES